MNFKERGVTVGDLLVISTVIVLAIFISNKFKENDKQTYLNINNREISTTFIF